MLILRARKVDLVYFQKWSGDWNRIYCVVTSVCVFRFVYTLHWGEIQRLRKCQVILNRIVSPIFRDFSDEDTMEEDQEDVEESLTHNWRHALMSRDLLTARFKCLFEGKIAQLCALVKSTIFIVENSNFEIVYFKRYIFILCGKKFASQAL